MGGAHQSELASCHHGRRGEKAMDSGDTSCQCGGSPNSGIVGPGGDGEGVQCKFTLHIFSKGELTL